LDEDLRIRREEELPVYERLGDVRARAVTMGKIADILQSRGELDEALRIRREEELPVYERLGDVRELLVARANMAICLTQCGAADDLVEARRLLELALEAALKMRLPEVKTIQAWLAAIGDVPPSAGPKPGRGKGKPSRRRTPPDGSSGR